MNIADDIHNAYNEGYEQGRFDGIMDATDGLAVCKGYDVVAVVRCKNCKHFDTDWTYCGGDVHFCKYHKFARREEDFCSNGELNENM